jgi:DNA-binding MarR family transcriptional regulator
MRQVTRAMTDFYNAIMEPSGLHGNQFTLLVPPYLQPGITINQLARMAGLDRTTLARNLKLLEERQLIAIQPGEDQRTRVIHVTDAGREAVIKALPLWEKAQQQMVDALGQAGLNQFFGYLNQLEEPLKTGSIE